MPSVVDGRDQPLLGAKPAQKTPMPRRFTGMAHQDRHHDLMHREDHAGRGAAAPERVTDVDNVADDGVLAA
jgi:hypothetical protein